MCEEMKLLMPLQRKDRHMNKKTKSTGYQEAKTIIKAKQIKPNNKNQTTPPLKPARCLPSTVKNWPSFNIQASNRAQPIKSSSVHQVQDWSIWTCQTSSMTTENLLQECPLHNILRTMEKNCMGVWRICNALLHSFWRRAFPFRSERKEEEEN